LSRSDPGVSAKDTIRLQVFLARCGIGSRRGCETLIRHGRVAVNGAPVTQLGTKVSPGDSVTLDGKVVVPTAKRTYIAIHKPREYLCANSDPQGRPLVSQLFSSAIRARLFHVGRLDYLSTGLILYTDDGEFSKIVSHPRAGIEKEYLVETGKGIDEEFLRQYSRGIRVGDQLYRCKSYILRGPHSALITLTEGKNREIRNVFTSRNIRLKRVHRLRVGPITLRGIPPGHFRRLTEREIRWFFDHGSSD
jgi:23S rRNA pseudouridine2605 synthase